MYCNAIRNVFKAHRYRQRFITLALPSYEAYVSPIRQFTFFFTPCVNYSYYVYFPFFLLSTTILYITSFRIGQRTKCLVLFFLFFIKNRREGWAVEEGMARISNHSTFSCKCSCVCNRFTFLPVRDDFTCNVEAEHTMSGYQVASE